MSFICYQVLINSKLYTNLEKLLVDLSGAVSTSTGVKHVFSWPDGREVKSITEFENGKYYVCSSNNKLHVGGGESGVDVVVVVVLLLLLILLSSLYIVTMTHNKIILC